MSHEDNFYGKYDKLIVVEWNACDGFNWFCCVEHVICGIRDHVINNPMFFLTIQTYGDTIFKRRFELG